jgi:hypothetical protein
VDNFTPARGLLFVNRPHALYVTLATDSQEILTEFLGGCDVWCAVCARENSRIPNKSVRLSAYSNRYLFRPRPEGLSTAQNPQAGRAEMNLFSVITRFVFGATMTLAGLTLFCEEILNYLS